MPTSLVLNGKNVTLDVNPNMPLLWVVRENTNLCGTRSGCGVTQHGACIVQLDDTAIRSCMLPVSAVVGKHVTTIEDIQSKPGKVVQDARVELQVPQCGYCQSGQIMPATALLEQNTSPSDADIDTAMNGNICRYATCVRIRTAIHEAADTLKA